MATLLQLRRRWGCRLTSLVNHSLTEYINIWSFLAGLTFTFSTSKAPALRMELRACVTVPNESAISVKAISFLGLLTSSVKISSRFSGALPEPGELVAPSSLHRRIRVFKAPF